MTSPFGRRRERPERPAGPTNYVYHTPAKGKHGESWRIGQRQATGLGSYPTPGGLFDAAARYRTTTGARTVIMHVRGTPHPGRGEIDFGHYYDPRTERATVRFTATIFGLGTGEPAIVDQSLVPGITVEEIVRNLSGYDFARVETIWLEH